MCSIAKAIDVGDNESPDDNTISVSLSYILRKLYVQHVKPGLKPVKRIYKGFTKLLTQLSWALLFFLFYLVTFAFKAGIDNKLKSL